MRHGASVRQRRGRAALRGISGAVVSGRLMRISPSKEGMRAETEALVAAYTNPISRSAGLHVQVRCECCALVSAATMDRR